LAEYRDNYQKIRTAGGDVAAIAVDEPERSESVRQGLKLPFPILCDTRREVVKSWGVFNAAEKGGIAVPAVFIVEPDRRIVSVSRDEVRERISAATIAEFFCGSALPDAMKRQGVAAKLGDFMRAAGTAFRFGIKSPRR
jgi:peroxiredoxin